MKSKAGRFDFRSLKFKLWVYFIVFAVAIIAIIWISQVYLLKTSYEKVRAGQVTSYANEVSSQYRESRTLTDSLVNSVRQLAIENDLDIIFEYSDGSIYMINQVGDGQFYPFMQQPMNSYVGERAEIKQYLESQGKFTGYSSRNLNGSDDYKILIYGTYLDAGDQDMILYLFAPLYPVSATVSILKDQLFYITILILVLSLLTAAFAASRITRPINSMRRSAVKLSQGVYGIEFNGGQYSEMIDLGKTLTYTSHELEKTDQLQKDLIANVSHDLRTPLTMVKSYAEMIRDLSGDVPEKRNRHLQVIIEETDRLNLLVDDMFTLSKMQAGVTAVEKTDFNLAEAAKEIYHSYDIIQEKDGYQIHFVSPEQIFVHGDENKLKQVIANLINNAVKYCGDDKFIEIELKEVNQQAVFSVTDHGIGIPQDQLASVWDRYYRVSSNYHRSRKGTGLGLSIVKQILTMHNADFGVDSKVGEGSRFWFSINTIGQSEEGEE